MASGTIPSAQVTKLTELSCFHQRTRSLPLTQEEEEETYGNGSQLGPSAIYPKNSISSLSSMHSSSNSSITELNGSSILRKLCETMCTQRLADGNRKHLSTCCFYQIDKQSNKNHTHKPIKYPSNRSTINNNHNYTDTDTMSTDSAYLLMTSSAATRKGMHNGSMEIKKRNDSQYTTIKFTNNYTEIYPPDSLILPSIIISAPHSSSTDHINQNMPSLTVFSTSTSSASFNSSSTLTPTSSTTPMALRCKGCNSLRSM